MQEEELREAEKGRSTFRKRRWWHRQSDITMRDPIKALRYNNLFIVPSELMKMRDIVTLQLTGCKVGDEAMTWVATFMQQSYTLRRINLQGNAITAAGCRTLVDGIRNCKTLIEFDISLNPIGDEGCSAICIALLDSGHGKDSKIYSVNLSTCNLSSGSAFQLARLIREGKVIQSLSLWRNNLGELVPHGRSAALQILDELVNNSTTSLRIIDLTANGLTDQDLSEHCRMLEANLRKNRLTDIEKVHLVQKVTMLREEIASLRVTAVWEKEKVELKRLEKEMAADMARLDLYKRMEDRNQTRETKLDEKFTSDIHRHTGGLELYTVPRRIRLVLNGNFSIQPTTLARLKEYYDIAPVQNIDMYANMPRRHVELLNYRRKIGEEFETRDHTQFDEHNIFTWDGDKYDPADDHRRRVSIAEYREAEDRKKERAKPVHFEKFKLNINGTADDLKNKKMVMGISVASGVNAKLKETQDEDEASGTGAFATAQQAKAKGNLKNISIDTVHKKTKTEADPILVLERAGGAPPLKMKQIRDATGTPSIEVVSGGEGISAADLARYKQQALAAFAGDEAEAEGPPTVSSAALKSPRQQQVDEENEREAQRYAEHAHARFEARSNEVRKHVAGRKSIFENGAGSPLVQPHTPRFSISGAAPPPSGHGSPTAIYAHRGSVFGSGYVPADAPTALKNSMMNSQRQSLNGTPDNSELAQAAADTSISEVERLVRCIGFIYVGWAKVRQCAEIGSPTDAELAVLEEARLAVATLKSTFLRALEKKHFGDPGQNATTITDPESADVIATFIEDLVKETDDTPDNVPIFDEMVGVLNLQTDAFNFATQIADRGLVPLAACDGSELFLSRLLKLATNGLDAVEVVSSCFYNGLARIQVTQILFDNLTYLTLDEQAMAELAPLTQEFFEDVASEKKALARENRKGRLEVLATLLDSQQFTIDLDHEGGDHQTIVSRALYEGDMPLLKMLLGRYRQRITKPNLVKSDRMSLLMMAVIGNHPEAVALFLDNFGKAVDVNLSVPADVGAAPTTAIDLAINLDRHPKIVEILRAHGAVLTGDQVASVALSNGKMTVSVKTK
eukprot:GILI01011067.1.p1 GENE.GILI01011067.1~~GILI01011067.1.p1  ORF type:complete len:1117 (+),score=281.68 GILI01011067.1:113-3352(+)